MFREWTWDFLMWSIVILSPPLLLLLHGRSKKQRQPPGPPGWPIFGHICLLGRLPHRTLAGLQQQYGPVVWLKLGSIDTLVLQNAKSAAELFKNHDISFADRWVNEAMRSHDFDTGSMSASPYNNYWRFLRRISTVELFTSKKVKETSPIREKCVEKMNQWIEQEEGGKIVITRFVFLALFNMVGNMTLSRDLVNPQSEMAQDFFDNMMEMMEDVATPNISDLFPWLTWFDFQGLRKKVNRNVGKALHTASGFAKERLRERQEGRSESKKAEDFLDVLLDFEGTGKDEPAKLSEQQVNIVMLEMFLAATETVSTTIEWAMAELLRNPKEMKKVKVEVAAVVGEQSGKLQDKDVGNLPYLHAVVKETMRLHPPVPLLVPRRSTKDSNFMGYHIPKNTQVLVNCWAIGRDPECWGDDALTFKPERFLGSDVDYKGNHFELIPFGAGRRMCVGVPLAQPTIFLFLGSLIHEFDWELDNDVTIETMDMKEKLGITARKLEPLKAIPRRAKIN